VKRNSNAMPSVLALLILTALLAGCGAGSSRSVAHFCTTLVEQKQQFSKNYDNSNEPLQAFVTGMASLGEIPVIFDRLDKVAPTAIEPAVAAVRDSLNNEIRQAGNSASNPLGALASGLVSALISAGPFQRVQDYIAANCGGAGGVPTATTQPGTATKRATANVTTAPTDGCVTTAPQKANPPSFTSAPPMTIDVSKTYVAHVATTCGDFDITLDPKVAPKTANSFVFLADQHFYDGLTFHRLVKDFVIQGGDPKGDGTGGPGYELPTEPPKDGYAAGSVAMANAGPGTTGSQFFVAVSENGAKGLRGPPYLYSDLGMVTKGMAVIQKLMTFAPASDGPPTMPLYIDNITITRS
jgi:cyclophilin family peptidyl-prolyl cis-trans isomerase